MSDLQKYKAKQMEDPEFRKEYETMRPELEVTRALIAARIAQHMTQEELSQKSGVRQSNISRIENGTASPYSCNASGARRRYGKAARYFLRIIPQASPYGGAF